MTLISRIRITRWSDGSLTGEVPTGRDESNNPIWARLSGRAIGTILGKVRGKDWDSWDDAVVVRGKPEAVKRYRSTRSWRMIVDESVLGRMDITSLQPEDTPTEEANEALAGANKVAKPAKRAAKSDATVDLAD